MLHTAQRSVVLGILATTLVGLAAAPAAAAEPAEPDVGTTIVGGQPARRAYPGVGSLQTPRNGTLQHFCGAWLVKPRHSSIATEWAATNAHCATRPDGTIESPLSIRFDSLNWTIGGDLVEVTAVVPNPAWDWATGDDEVSDIALLRLAHPITVPGLAFTWPDRHDATRIVGWGLTSHDPGATPPADLQQLDTRIAAPHKCAAAGITADEICVSNPNGAGACYGDSGSPALQPGRTYRWDVVGSASRNSSPVCGATPTVYVNPAYHRDWITRTLRNGPPPVINTKKFTSAAAYTDWRWAPALR